MEAEGKLFFDDFFSAHAEAQRRRKFLDESGIVTRVEESPYGGYQISSIPVELVAEEPFMAPISWNIPVRKK